MNGMKFNAALIFAIVLQAIALVWYVSKIDSRVNILYEKYEVDSDAQVVENQVRMKLSIETLIEDVEAIQKELSKARSKDEKIMKQHEEIVELLQNNTSGSSSYDY